LRKKNTEKEAKDQENQSREQHIKNRKQLKIRMTTDALQISNDDELKKFNSKYVHDLHELLGASIYIGDVEDDTIKYSIFSKDCEKQLRGSVLHRTKGRSFHAIDNEESILIHNAAEDPHLSNLKGEKKNEHTGSVFISPIKSLSGIKGTLTIDKSHLGEGENKFDQDEDKKFLDAIAKQFENAQKNVDLERKLQLIRQESERVFNKQRESVFKVGMEQLLSIIPNATQAVTGNLDSPTSMECISITERQNPNSPKNASVVGKSIDRGEHPEFFDVVQKGEIAFINSPESRGAFFDSKADESSNIEHGDAAISIPIRNEETGKVVGVINIDTSGELTPEQLEQVKRITEEITKRTHEVEVRENLTSMSNSALEWIKATTNAKGAYFGLLQNDGTLKYVAASEGNEHMIGRTLERGTGVTFDAIDSGKMTYVPNIAKDPKIHMFKGAMAKKTGSFAALPIRSKETNQVIGILAVDKVGTTDEFSPEELKNLERSSNIISGSIPMLEKSELGADRPSERLAIEKDLAIVKDKAKLYFLSKMLLACRDDINKLDQKSIAELVGYKTPPAAVHKIIKGVLYILGHKKNEIKEWEGCRKLLKDNFLKRVISYDPTAIQKKIKFVNCKKAITGLDYETVEKKSSIPAAFLFKFTIVTLQLRENAVNLRKLAKMAVEEEEGGESDEDELAKASSKLQQSRPLSSKSVGELFDIFDGNGNGKLSFSEISGAVLRNFPQFANDKPAIMRAYKAVDVNNDGYVTKKEFPHLISMLEQYLDMFQLFKHLDVDGDKRISYNEFKKGHELIGITAHSDSELKKLFENMDSDKGGWILFGEFCSFMVALKVQQQNTKKS
jgi:Ca2+-binding EF-hand superfamily protein/GAF domain-containing protein